MIALPPVLDSFAQSDVAALAYATDSRDALAIVDIRPS